jgi:ketosteroid isomerase-like protein
MDDEARDTIERFHEAFNRRDLDALGDLITDDCVFEATRPAPDGTRYVGREAVLKAWRCSSQTRQPRILRLRRCELTTALLPNWPAGSRGTNRGDGDHAAVAAALGNARLAVLPGTHALPLELPASSMSCS